MIVKGITGIPTNEVQTYKRGERLEAYLTQPFYVAEAFTGKKGASVNLADTINDIRKILDGVTDSKEVEELTFIGNI
ncbi:hypothetical protein [Peribacillus alkalitolerans]|uniref:hypothetical protein n=1 Tax=Peribacillus alkalitolerans TaxID=1550385 RepID=UPI0019679836